MAGPVFICALFNLRQYSSKPEVFSSRAPVPLLRTLDSSLLSPLLLPERVSLAHWTRGSEAGLSLQPSSFKLQRFNTRPMHQHHI